MHTNSLSLGIEIHGREIQNATNHHRLLLPLSKENIYLLFAKMLFFKTITDLLPYIPLLRILPPASRTFHLVSSEGF